MAEHLLLACTVQRPARCRCQPPAISLRGRARRALASIGGHWRALASIGEHWRVLYPSGFARFVEAGRLRRLRNSLQIVVGAVVIAAVGAVGRICVVMNVTVVTVVTVVERNKTTCRFCGTDESQRRIDVAGTNWPSGRTLPPGRSRVSRAERTGRLCGRHHTLERCRGSHTTGVCAIAATKAGPGDRCGTGWRCMLRGGSAAGAGRGAAILAAAPLRAEGVQTCAEVCMHRVQQPPPTCGVITSSSPLESSPELQSAEQSALHIIP